VIYCQDLCDDIIIIIMGKAKYSKSNRTIAVDQNDGCIVYHAHHDAVTSTRVDEGDK
jgi:hypothetical protein